MASFVRINLFPASVTVNGAERFSPCRVVVTDDSVHVYVDAPGGPQEAYTARLDDFSGRRTIGYTVVTDEGDELSIGNAGGCGCGSRLRGYHPFQGVPQIATP